MYGALDCVGPARHPSQPMTVRACGSLQCKCPDLAEVDGSRPWRGAGVQFDWSSSLGVPRRLGRSALGSRRSSRRHRSARSMRCPSQMDPSSAGAGPRFPSRRVRGILCAPGSPRSTRGTARPRQSCPSLRSADSRQRRGPACLKTGHPRVPRPCTAAVPGWIAWTARALSGGSSQAPVLSSVTSTTRSAPLAGGPQPERGHRIPRPDPIRERDRRAHRDLSSYFHWLGRHSRMTEVSGALPTRRTGNTSAST